jgi:hypothetical protein
MSYNYPFFNATYSLVVFPIDFALGMSVECCTYSRSTFAFLLLPYRLAHQVKPNRVGSGKMVLFLNILLSLLRLVKSTAKLCTC